MDPIKPNVKISLWSSIRDVIDGNPLATFYWPFVPRIGDTIHSGCSWVVQDVMFSEVLVMEWDDGHRYNFTQQVADIIVR